MEKNQYLTDFRASLEKLAMSELRQKASKIFGIKLTREHKAEEIIQLIMSQVESANYTDVAEGDLKPGYARIKLNRAEGRASLVYLNCNGYYCWIPVDIEVDVPIKLIDILENAKEMKKVLNEFNEYVDVMSLSYPYNVIAKNPGADPKPGREAQTDAKWKAYQRFYAKHKFWPSQRVLQQATAANVHFNQYEEESDSE